MIMAAEGFHVGRDNRYIQLFKLSSETTQTYTYRFIDSYGYQVRSVQIILVVVIQVDLGY